MITAVKRTNASLELILPVAFGPGSKSQLTLLLFLTSQDNILHPQMGSVCSSLVFETLRLHPHFQRERVRTLNRHKIGAQGVLSYLSYLQRFCFLIPYNGAFACEKNLLTGIST